MLNKIIRMLQSRCYEFLFLTLVTFVVPTLPMWYRKRIGDIPKFNAVQAVLCICYCASAWAPALWKVG